MISTMITAFEGASQLQEPPKSVKSLLSLITLRIGRHSVDSATKFAFKVFRCMQPHIDHLLNVLRTLEQMKPHHMEATHALLALQQNGRDSPP